MFQVTTDPEDQELATIFGDKVAYMSHGSGRTDIFLSRLVFDSCGDSEGDGFPDEEELAAGSDPDNPSSIPALLPKDAPDCLIELSKGLGKLAKVHGKLVGRWNARSAKPSTQPRASRATATCSTTVSLTAPARLPEPQLDSQWRPQRDSNRGSRLPRFPRLACQTGS
ncbi:MAG: hypothetical protein ACE5FG_11950 [Myxococcota bacterium]